MERGEQTIPIYWPLPQEPWVKFNCDGVSKENPGNAEVDGIIRDNYGELICGFYSFLGVQNIVFIELYSVVQGLEVYFQKGIHECLD